MKKKGFTLIELLVVIAIIALLLAILMPALRRAKKAAMQILCLANVKTLATGWMLYTQNNDNMFPIGYTRSNPDGWILEVAGHRTNPWLASKELQQDALREGTLYPYVENVKVYRCSLAEKNEFRTYSLPHSIGGWAHDGSDRIVRKTSQVRNSADRMLFLDDYAYDWDGAWMIYYRQAKWWNSTPIRHGSGGNVFSFVDGHADFHLWKDKRTVDYGIKCFEAESAGLGMSPEPDNEDIKWAQLAVWGALYKP